MRPLIVTVAILVVTSTAVSTQELIKEPLQCLDGGKQCGLSSKPCCEEKPFGNISSSAIQLYCDYLGSRVCATPDKIYRYADVLQIEKLKDYRDFKNAYDNYVQSLAKIQDFLVMRDFMDRIYETKPKKNTSKLGKVSLFRMVNSI